MKAASVILGVLTLWTALGAAVGTNDLRPDAARLMQAGGKDTRSVRDGVYSAAQAERGSTIYTERCASCHVADQFTGFVFMQSWSGQTADALYDLIRTTMPKDNPGVLKPQEYADVIAYILKMNRLPAGETELKGTKPALKQVVIEEPAKR